MKSALVTIALLVASTWAWAGEDDLKQTELLYKQMQYEKALKMVTAVLESPSANPNQLVAGYRLQGLCLSALGRTEESVMAFRRLLAIDPAFHLSRDVSPKLSPPFSKALTTEQKPIALSHNPPETVKMLAGQELEVTLQSDPLGMVGTVRLLLSGDDTKEHRVETAVTGPGKIMMKLPHDIKVAKVSYYFEATNKFGGVLCRLGTKEKPFELQVKVMQPPAVVGLPSSGGHAGSVTALAAKEQLLATTESDRGKKTSGTPFYKTWWFWTIVGVAVVGAAAGTGIAISKGKESGGSYDNYSITIK